MKAIINGVAVEGTPEEIAKYQELIAKNAEMKAPSSPFIPWKEPVIGPYSPYKWNEVYCGNYNGKKA